MPRPQISLLTFPPFSHWKKYYLFQSYRFLVALIVLMAIPFLPSTSHCIQYYFLLVFCGISHPEFIFSLKLFWFSMNYQSSFFSHYSLRLFCTFCAPFLPGLQRAFCTVLFVSSFELCWMYPTISTSSFTIHKLPQVSFLFLSTIFSDIHRVCISIVASVFPFFSSFCYIIQSPEKHISLLFYY